MQIACNLQDLSHEERERRTALADELTCASVRVTELAYGYSFEIMGGAATLRKVHELVALERRCCPFLTIELTSEPATGLTVLTITGGRGVKEFIAAQFLDKEAS